ncbi:hypothetical protein [Pseudomonas syringae]|uniref:hypothetical protein n=1 Tax=Pseudomonas syringae TaxID=317 RepID=UPI000E3221CB|nr:hypothetical protein [Pseudomonas syringae]
MADWVGSKDSKRTIFPQRAAALGLVLICRPSTIDHKLPFAKGSNRPILLKKSVSQTASILIGESVFFMRCHVKSESEYLCADSRF